MPRKSQRHFDDVDRKTPPDALEVARRACVQACRKSEIRGEAHLAAEKVKDTADDAALVLTGNREPSWLKAH